MMSAGGPCCSWIRVSGETVAGRLKAGGSVSMEAGVSVVRCRLRVPWGGGVG
jgi:hypothetical protein